MTTWILTVLLVLTSAAGARAETTAHDGKASYLNSLYRAILGREPDAAGLAYWREDGSGPAAVAVSLGISGEARSKHPSDAAWLEFAYAAFLGRASDPEGLAYWVGRLADGMSREAVLWSFVNAGECRVEAAKRGGTACSALAALNEPDARGEYTSLATVRRIAVTLDDGSSLQVDNASHMPDADVAGLVVAADRSTQSGCPYLWPRKGLIKGGPDGDRVFVSDHYLAWFDYTLEDGVGGARWARSGALTGFWSLDPRTRNFKYTYATYSPEGEYPDENGICWNWARNELIVGSNSPQGQYWWWDKHAPPVEQTFVFTTDPKTWTADPTSKYNLFATNYTQGAPGSGFSRSADGTQDAAGVHYATGGRLTSWRGDTTFHAVDPKTHDGPVSGRIDYALDFVCRQKEIQIVWTYSSNVGVKLVNSYVDVWLQYSGLGQSSTCGSPQFTVPTRVFGRGAEGKPYHPYDLISSSLEFYTQDETGNQRPATPGSVVPFPWDEAIPCNGIGLNVAGATKPPEGGVPAGATFTVGSSTSERSLKFVNRVAPNSGAGTASNPRGLPYVELLAGYENSDQQMGFMMANQSGSAELEAGKHYITSYSIALE